MSSKHDGEGRRDALMFAAGVLVALLPAYLLYDFTVDDALIPARYAAHVAAGVGYRFNTGGPVSDGVTPLGWAHLLAPFARGGPIVALAAAKVLGVVTWTLAAGALALAIDRAGHQRLRFLSLALVGCSAPLGAWSVAGLETGVVTAMATLAVVAPTFRWPMVGMALAGLCAAWRPELLPWALVLSLTPAPALIVPVSVSASVPAPAPASVPASAPASAPASVPASASVPAPVPVPASVPASAPVPASASALLRAFAPRVALVLTPFLLVALIRTAVFGHAAPLAAIAKAPDTRLGVNYAVACFLLTGPIALVAPLAWGKLSGHARGLILATLTHFVAIALAGGDWMPLSRLAVPVLPTAALAAAHVLCVADARVAVARLVLAVAGELFAAWRAGPSAARVGRDRMAVIEQTRPLLSRAQVVASLDIGWVGAATEATVVDLAGVTDPAVASLPGGHTSKQIPASLFAARGVDTVVLLVKDGQEPRDPWYETMFARAVEYRVAVLARDDFELAATSEGRLRYLVLRRVGRREAAAPLR